MNKLRTARTNYYGKKDAFCFRKPFHAPFLQTLEDILQQSCAQSSPMYIISTDPQTAPCSTTSSTCLDLLRQILQKSNNGTVISHHVYIILTHHNQIALQHIASALRFAKGAYLPLMANYLHKYDIKTDLLPLFATKKSFLTL